MEGGMGQEVEDILRPLIISYWEETIEDDIRENGILADLYTDEEMIDGERRVQETVEGILAEYGLAQPLPLNCSKRISAPSPNDDCLGPMVSPNLNLPSGCFIILPSD